MPRKSRRKAPELDQEQAQKHYYALVCLNLFELKADQLKKVIELATSLLADEIAYDHERAELAAALDALESDPAQPTG